MPRIKLTDRAVQAIEAPEKGQVDYFDDRLPGFGLRVSQGGHKTWIVAYRHAGRFRRFTIGRYPYITLSDARAQAKDALHAVAHGRDPGSEKQAERHAESFQQLAQEYMDRHAKLRKRSWREDQRIVDRELLPSWRHIKARLITRRHVREVLDAVIERDAPVQANRTFALIRKMFNFGVERDIVDVNPCHGLRCPVPERRRDRVLSPEEIQAVWNDLEHEPPCNAAVFMVLLLTAQRIGEVLTMRWEDVHLEFGWWTIPPQHAKNRMAHRVPLSPQARAVLEGVRGHGHSGLWVFQSPKTDGRRLNVQRVVLRIRKRTEVDFTPHDLRRTAASYMTSMGINRLTVAKILNHAERGVTAVYDRHSYDQEKRQALDAWGVRLEEIVAGIPRAANVVPLHRM